MKLTLILISVKLASTSALACNVAFTVPAMSADIVYTVGLSLYLM